MKNVYIIGGTMGVGKTTVCQQLKKQLDDSVFLDADWCWDADPFQVTDETKAMVIDNICHLLNNFIACTAYKNVIFCWVMNEQSIVDSIINRIDNAENCEIKIISLVCDEETLINRLSKDITAGLRTQDVVERSLGRIKMYSKMNTIKVITDSKTPQDIADEIMKL